MADTCCGCTSRGCAMVYDFLMDDIDGMVDNLGVSAGIIRTALAVLKPDS